MTNRPFSHFNNSTRARFCCNSIFVNPDLDSAPLFAGMRERSIWDFIKKNVSDLIQ